MYIYMHYLLVLHERSYKYVRMYVPNTFNQQLLGFGGRRLGLGLLFRRLGLLGLDGGGRGVAQASSDTIDNDTWTPKVCIMAS